MVNANAQLSIALFLQLDKPCLQLVLFCGFLDAAVVCHGCPCLVTISHQQRRRVFSALPRSHRSRIAKAESLWRATPLFTCQPTTAHPLATRCKTAVWVVILGTAAGGELDRETDANRNASTRSFLRDQKKRAAVCCLSFVLCFPPSLSLSLTSIGFHDFCYYGVFGCQAASAASASLSKCCCLCCWPWCDHAAGRHDLSRTSWVESKSLRCFFGAV